MVLDQMNTFFIPICIRMGSILPLVVETTLPEHCHPGHTYQFELWSILICRVISEYLCRGVTNKKWIPKDQFRMKNILLCRTMSACIINSPIYPKTMVHTQQCQSTQMFKSILDYMHKQIYEKGVAYDRFQIWIILLWRVIADYAYHKPFHKKGKSTDPFVNLPEVC